MTSVCGEQAPAPQTPLFPAGLVPRPRAWTAEEGSGISRTPLLPSLRNEENGRACPALPNPPSPPTPGASGWRRDSACNVPRGTPAELGAGRKAHSRTERERRARGRYQAAAARRARAVTWLAASSSARNGGKTENRGRAASRQKEAGAGQFSRGGGAALARAGLWGSAACGAALAHWRGTGPSGLGVLPAPPFQAAVASDRPCPRLRRAQFVSGVAFRVSTDSSQKTAKGTIRPWEPCQLSMAAGTAEKHGGVCKPVLKQMLHTQGEPTWKKFEM